VSRFRIGLALLSALIACSPKAPAPGETPQAPAAAQAPPAIATTGGAPAPSAAPSPPPDPREAALSNAVFELIEQEHLLRPHIDDALSRTAFASYLDRIDGGKMFLLVSDRDALGRYADKIDDEMRSGSLDLAHEGEKRFESRVLLVQGWVAQILAQPMSFTADEYVETDPKKVQPAATEAELKDRWRRRLELEVLERVTAMETSLAKNGSGAGSGSAGSAETDPAILKIPATPELREAKAREELARSYAARFARLREPAPLEAASELLNAVTSSVDPHTDYLPPADKANFDIQMTGSLEGIGAVLREKDHLIEINELVPGGASFRQGGLTPGDLILSVVPAEGKEAVDIYDMPIEDVVKMIRGPKGTVVRLRVQKASGETTTVAITRDVVVLESAYARGAVIQRKGKPAYGYILLPSFYGGQGPNQRTAAGDVGKLITELKAKKVAGIILDIRSNGGGLLTDAVKLTGELVDEGPVVQVQDNHGRRETLSDDTRGELFDGPVVVMVDQFSASASEIVAAALQDYHRAVIVGNPTHGKGTVQTVVDLDKVTGAHEDLGSLKLTIEQFFRITGGSTQREGVTPDVVLPNPAGYVDTGERTLDHAIAWSHVDPAMHADWPATWKDADLVAKSTTRVAKDPILSKIAAAVAVLRARKDDTRVPLQRTAWLARRDAQKAALDAASPELDKQPAQFTVTPIGEAVPAATSPPVPTPAGANGKPPVDALTRWRDNLARDPWVAEGMNVLGDIPAR
jgi:carboxyl-terminal processing protease